MDKMMEDELTPELQAESPSAERGQSLVEFAISVVFIFFILAGIADLGRAFFIFMAVRDAAQEGAVYGSFCPHDLTGILERVQDSAQGSIVDLSVASYNNDTPIRVECQYLLGAGQTACSTTLGSVSEGNRIRIRVLYKQFQISMPFIGAFVGQSFPIQAEMVNAVLSTGCPVNP